jgi:LPXTG-motif cell wall-anchored protein
VTLSSASVRAGGTVTVDVAGATRDGSVEVWLHSTPVRLAVVQADASGVASRTVTIPAATETGTHRIQVVDTTTGVSVWSGELTVTPAATGSGLASTGAEVTSLAVVALLLLGAGTLAVRRRRLAQD